MIRIGCPVWANKDWLGTLFSHRAKPADYLRQYARVFDTVEGSATFYSLPSPETVLRWRMETPENFRFVFKFPRTITHDYMLRQVGNETQQFLRIMQPLAARIGMLFLQLPPAFNRQAMPLLESYLQQLPPDFNYAVEVRHRDFFDRPELANALDQLLEKHNVNRAVFDTSELHQTNANDELSKEAQRKKPKMPTYFSLTAQMPMIRYVGHALPEDNLPRLQQVIIPIVLQWMEQGRTPYIFMHTPGDLYAPQLCRLFHQLLQEALQQKGMLPLPQLPPFWGEMDNRRGEQGKLFG